MKVKKIKVGFSQTKKIGMYENIKPSIELEIELNEKENLNAVVEESFAKCRMIIKKQLDLGGI